jgi:hypothetical protein
MPVRLHTRAHTRTLSKGGHEQQMLLRRFFVSFFTRQEQPGSLAVCVCVLLQSPGTFQSARATCEAREPVGPPSNTHTAIPRSPPILIYSLIYEH